MLDLLGKILKEIREIERDYENAEIEWTGHRFAHIEIIKRQFLYYDFNSLNMCLLHRKGKIAEIIHEVEAVIEEVFEYIRANDYNSFVLLIGRGEVFPGLKNTEWSDCVMDYQMDRYHDETRERFYLNYLNRNYRRDGFDYSGKSGIDDLSIEMMIYTHLWESYYFFEIT